MLNLVINETAETPDPEDEYFTSEFRHNEQLAGKKGLKIIVNTIYDGKQTYTIDLKK